MARNRRHCISSPRPSRRLSINTNLSARITIGGSSGSGHGTVAACAAEIFRASVRCARNGLMSGENPAATAASPSAIDELSSPTTNPGWPWRREFSASPSIRAHRTAVAPAGRARLAAAARKASSRAGFDRADETQAWRAGSPRARAAPRVARRAARRAPSARRSVRAWAAARRTAAACSRRGCGSARSRLSAYSTAWRRTASRLPVELDQVALALEPVFLPVRQREPHRAHGFARHGAAGTGDAAHGQRHVAPVRSIAPSAMARTTSSLTAPSLSMSFSGTPRSRVLAAFE